MPQQVSLKRWWIHCLPGQNPQPEAADKVDESMHKEGGELNHGEGSPTASIPRHETIVQQIARAEEAINKDSESQQQLETTTIAGNVVVD